MTEAPAARLESLDEIERALWAELELAPHDRRHPWRVGVLATTDGTVAEARHVVLRSVDPAQRLVIFYADSRSAKVQQIAAYPDGTLVLWSPALSWQLRLRVRLAVETTGLSVSSRWAQLKMSPAAQDYLSPLPPGSEVDHPRPERGSRSHFGVVNAAVQALDWLELHPEGHRRALFDAQGRRWLVP